MSQIFTPPRMVINLADTQIIESLTKEILQLGNHTGVDSLAMVAAMADALAIIAATLDRESDKQALEERLETFEDRVKGKYQQVLLVMAQRNWDPS